MKQKGLMLTVLSTIMFVGCISEQERQAMVAAEKARQEQLAKERAAEERATKINAIAHSIDIYELVILVKTSNDDEIRKAAVIRLQNIAKDPVSVVKTMQQPTYQVQEDRDKDEKPWYSVERRSDGMRIIHVQRRVGRKTGIVRYSEKDLEDLCARVRNECEQERAGFQESKTRSLVAKLARKDVIMELADVAKKCETAEIRNAALDVIVLTRSHASTIFYEEFMSSSPDSKDTKEEIVPQIEVQFAPGMSGLTSRMMSRGKGEKVMMYVSAELANMPDEIERRKKAFLLRRKFGRNSSARVSPRRESFQVCLADIAKNSVFSDVRVKAFENMEHDIATLKEIESKSADPVLRAAAGKKIALKKVASSRGKDYLAKIVAEDKPSEMREAARKKLKAMEELELATTKALDKYYDDLAEHNYNLALKGFKGKEHIFHMVKFLSDYEEDADFGRKKINTKLIESDKPWQKLVGPRRKLSEEEKNGGKAKLEEFGTQFLPNTYSNYEKIRDQAMEIQQMFNEEFPDPFSLKEVSPKWNAYTKLLKGLMKVRTQMFRRHDELCHFYLLHKVGSLSAADLAKIDSGKISIWLYEENRYISFADAGITARELTKLEDKLRVFAEKQAPETYVYYQKCETARVEAQKLLGEILSDVRIMDITRFELPVVACREKIDFITQTLNALAADFQAWQVEYKTMEKDAAAIAELDHKTAMQWKGFVELLPDYIKERSEGPLIAANSPMGKYYPCDIIQRWHWNALGFRGVVEWASILQGRQEGVVTIGKALDAPTFLTGMDEKLFNQTHKTEHGDQLDAICWKLLDTGHSDSRRLQYSSEISKNGWISINVLTALGADWEYQSRYRRSGVKFRGFSRQSVFLARLNEIDAGKAEYIGIARAGMKESANDWKEREGWLVIKMK